MVPLRTLVLTQRLLKSNFLIGTIDTVYLVFMADKLPSTGSMTLTQLAYVVAVDTQQHFGRAAEACNVTQPTLSMQLSKLERTLGVILFDRSHAPVVPTEVGRIIIAQARVALREAARVMDVRDAAAGIVAGELRLGVIPTLAPYLLPSVVPALTRQYPQLELIIEERVTDDILEGLRRDTLDAGIVASPVAVSHMVERVLFSEPFVCYVSASHRLAKRKSITPADLSLDDLWLLSEGHCFRTQTVRLCSERAAKGSRSE
ncbi:MAG: LysR substrate-binding domain-containing protein, partial [Acidobacteriota bacterium]|nr:LysR substrate-binding domain-containing protein [Acidobacteriota bacterium]